MIRTLIRLAVVLVLLTASCRAEVAFVLDIDEEGSGRFGAELGIDEEMKNLLTAGGEDVDPATIFEDFNLEGVPGATTREETRDDLTVYIADAPFTDLTALRADFVDDPDSPFRSFDLNVGEDSATMKAEISFPDATGDLSGDELPFDPSTLTEDIFKIAFRVTMPGDVTSHNADRVLSDGTLEWTLPLTGGTVTAEAASDYGSGSFPTWLIVLALLVAAGIALMVVATIRNRRVPAAAVADASAAADAGEFSGPADYGVETSAGVALGQHPAMPTPEATIPEMPAADPFATGGQTLGAQTFATSEATAADAAVGKAARASDEARSDAIRAADEAVERAARASDEARSDAIEASDEEVEDAIEASDEEVEDAIEASDEAVGDATRAWGKDPATEDPDGDDVTGG